MAITNFPPIELADEHGLLALGGDLEVETLLLAYRRGIFPWPISEEFPLAWFSPDPRGVLTKDTFHRPKSLQKLLNKAPFRLDFNKNFEETIRACAQVHSSRGTFETWITDEIIAGYLKLHRAGYAYSAEAYNDQDELVGGLYGVHVGGYLTGESMFYKEDNASKFVLSGLMEFLFSCDITWLDTQMVTPVVKSLGGVEIPRKVFIERLKKSASENEKQNIFLEKKNRINK